jgi:hypothetical protein
VILMMAKPTKLYEIQQLAGRIAGLSWFIARLGEKALPFYALTKKSSNKSDKFEWYKWSFLEVLRKSSRFSAYLVFPWQRTGM